MSDDNAFLLDLGDLRDKRQLMLHVGSLKGLWEVRFKERKRARSLDANKFYFVAVVQPWRDFLREAYGDPTIDKEQAHEVLKEIVLGRKLLKDKSGREIKLPPRTRDMDKEEFAQYVEAAIKFVAEFAGIVVAGRRCI